MILPPVLLDIKILIPILVNRNEDFMPDAFRMKNRASRGSFVGEPLSGLIIVAAETDKINVRILFYHLPQHMIRHTAGSGVAISLPFPCASR